MEPLAAQLENIYDEFETQLFGCALAITSCGGLAEDAVHNAFYKAFQLKFTPDNLKAYVFRSVRNAAIDLMRREKRTVPITADMLFEFAPDAGQLDQVERNDIRQCVTEALTLLSEDERETVVQHLVGHLTFQEIAALRERPMGTVTSWYRRGLKKLQVKLKGEFRSDSKPD